MSPADCANWHKEACGRIAETQARQRDLPGQGPGRRWATGHAVGRPGEAMYPPRHATPTRK
eukprot:12894071-Prorocentrum_lima.AAC.1